MCKECGVKPVIQVSTYPGINTHCEDCYKAYRKQKLEAAAKEKINHIIPKKYIEVETDHEDLIGKPDESMFINGKPGTGKTVLACSIAKRYIRSGYDVKFINFAAFIMELQSAFGKKTTQDVFYRQDPFEMAEETAKFHGALIIDDLGAEKLTDFVKQIIYFIINEREQRCLTTIITSNFTLGELDQHIDSRISSRIAGMCRVVKLNGVDRRIKK